MKISKLFHWLYACLMLLPIFAIGVSCLYVTFNQNAKDSFSGNYNYVATQSIDTYLNTTQASTTTSNTINTRVYYKVENYNLGGEFHTLNYDLTLTDSFNNGHVILNVSNLVIDNVSKDNIRSIVIWRYASTQLWLTYFDIPYDFDNFYCENNGVSGNSYYDSVGNLVSSSIGIVYFVRNSSVQSHNISFDNDENSIYYKGNRSVLGLFEKNIFYTDTNLSSVFYSSINMVNNAPLFAWASDSFLVQPIQYLTNIFGCPSDSPIITMLSYWLNISIIWLCFDLIMYVPLLAHRWIDKGIKE